MRDYAGFFKLCEIAYFMRYKVNYANIMPDHNPGHSNTGVVLKPGAFT